jgi:CheY-like chemotaxis protein
MSLGFDRYRDDGVHPAAHSAAAVGDAPAPQGDAGEGAPRSLEQRLAGVNVLVVEDEPDAREVVGALLESRGARVVLTASAAEAYSSLARELPDVIVSDIGMPGEDGYQFVRRVRTFAPERGGSTPIVALTAYASAQDRLKTREAGYTHHLAKPVDADELVDVLAALSRGGPDRSLS